MNRLIVLGGQGWFGHTLVEQLKISGMNPLTAGRHPSADLLFDAENSASIRATVHPGDLVIDAAGPFQSRSLTLIQAALEISFDVIDINDNLFYAQQVFSLEPEIARAGIRVLSSASSVSAISAALVQESGIANPVRVTCFLAPATRHTANPGSALSLIQSVGRSVQALRNGQLQTLRGWSEKRQFTMPPTLGQITGRLFESADALFLPRIWPSLQTVEMFVDANIPGINAILCLAARLPPLRNLLVRSLNLGTKISKLLGSSAGGIAYEIEATPNHIVRLVLLSAANSFIVAVAPVILAAQAVVNCSSERTGLILPHQHVDRSALWSFLESHGIELTRL